MQNRSSNKKTWGFWTATRDILFLIRKSRRLGNRQLRFGTTTTSATTVHCVSVGPAQILLSFGNFLPLLTGQISAAPRGAFMLVFWKNSVISVKLITPQDHLLSALPKFRNKQIYLHVLSSSVSEPLSVWISDIFIYCWLTTVNTVLAWVLGLGRNSVFKSIELIQCWNFETHAHTHHTHTIRAEIVLIQQS